MLSGVAEMYHRVSQVVWDESLWFPPGVNWTTLRSTETEKYPDFSDLYLPIAYAFVVLLIRFCFEWSFARPLGRYLGIRDTYSELPHFFHKIQRFFSGSVAERRRPASISDTDDSHKVNGTGTVPKRDESPLPRHGRVKSGTHRPHLVTVKSTLDKFAESCWRGTYYLGIFLYGSYILWDKPWFWDTFHLWYGYPFQPITPGIWWYYMIEASFYWSLMFSQFVDVQRKDFWVNFIHHIATILLMYFSWCDNFVRVGTLVLIVHDAADFWMEGAKMARYCKKDTCCNVLFAVFALVWFITRVGIYPFWIIYSALVEAPALIGFYSAYYVFNFLLLLLLVLHVFWSIMILNIIVNTLKYGKQADDVRSDDEDESSEDSEPKLNGNNNVRRRRKLT